MRTLPMANASQRHLYDLLARVPVVPVVRIDRAQQAVPMARALLAGGLPVIEVTLRTPAAMDAIRAIVNQVEGVVVGVGTVLNVASLREAEAAGAAFAVSPGATPRLLEAADDGCMPLLPGAATPSEAMALYEHGYAVQKWFPAARLGGPDMLRSLAGPLPMITFCPTGGIGPRDVAAYRALPNVVCVGGSWLTPADRMAAGDFGALRRLAADTVAAADRGISG